MDTDKKHGAKKGKGNLNEDPRTQNSEENPVTKIKLPEVRKHDDSSDLKGQIQRLTDQGRRDKI